MNEPFAVASNARKHIVRGVVLLASALMLFIACLLVHVVTVSAAKRSGDTNSEACIQCHAIMYDVGLRQKFVHPPFFERQCGVCHLDENSKYVMSNQKRGETPIETSVSQKDLWRKPQIYRGESRTFDQFFNLIDLRQDTDYRVRIMVGEEPDKALATSRWLGLNQAEITASDGQAQIVFAETADTPILDYVSSLHIATFSSGSAIIAWQTADPLYGWLELQTVEGIELPELSSLQVMSAQPVTTENNQHPPLREPEDLAITACYQCHPASMLGTSHPIRLYNGQDVRIPDDLPTVEGMLTCVTCHDPHGSEGKMLVRETIKTKLCVACHFKYKNSSLSTMFD